MFRYLLILFVSEYRFLLCNRPTFNTSAHVYMYNRVKRVVNCRCVYIDWVFRFDSRQMSVCLLRAALLVLLESADRFAATID